MAIKVVSEFGYFSTFIILPRVCGPSFLQVPALNLHMCAKWKGASGAWNAFLWREKHQRCMYFSDNFWESYQNCTHINLYSACAQGKSRMWCRRRSNCKTLRRQSTLVVRFNQAQNTLPHQQLTQLTTNCGQIREEWETALLLLYPRCNIHLWCRFFTNILPVQNQYRFKSVFRRVSGRNVGDFWSAF